MFGPSEFYSGKSCQWVTCPTQDALTGKWCNLLPVEADWTHLPIVQVKICFALNIANISYCINSKRTHLWYYDPMLAPSTWTETNICHDPWKIRLLFPRSSSNECSIASISTSTIKREGYYRDAAHELRGKLSSGKFSKKWTKCGTLHISFNIFISCQCF